LGKVVSNFLPLGFFDGVKINGDIKTAALFIEAAYHHTLAFYLRAAEAVYAFAGKVKPDHDFGKRRDVLIDMAIGAQAADILGAGGKVIAVSRYLDGEFLLYAGVKPSFRAGFRGHFFSSFAFSR
jgi:hypothetical protein